MIPDIEAIVRDYLRTRPSVTAITNRIVSKMPAKAKTDAPWVQVTLTNAPQLAKSRPDHLVPFALQLDCYAGYTGGKPEANDLVRTVRAALGDLEGAQSGGVVTGVRFTGMFHVPDPDLRDSDDNQRERYILDATVYAHS